MKPCTVKDFKGLTGRDLENAAVRDSIIIALRMAEAANSTSNDPDCSECVFKQYGRCKGCQGFSIDVRDLAQ